VRRTGERRRFGGVVVVVAAGVPGPARVAVVAGRRVGTAVARNRAKRRLREALRRAAVPGGRDYIVIASAAVNEAPFEDVVAWIRRAVEE
jgi:ribonuclease P protein component